MTTPRYIFGPYTLADSGRVLLREGELVPATPKVLATLLVLVRAEGTAVSKEDLLNAVWPDSFVEDGNLTQNISVLRKLIAADYPDGSPIETIARFGYRFGAELIVADQSEGAAGAGSVRAPEPDEPPGTFRPPAPEAGRPSGLPPGDSHSESVPEQRAQADGSPGQRVEWLPSPASASPSRPAEWRSAGLRVPFLRSRLSLLASAVLAIAAVLVLVAGLHKRKVSAAANRALHPRIAVLAFTNLSRAPDATWLSDALRETIISDLGGDPNLRVLPGESVERAERELQLGRTDGLSRETLGRVCHDLDCDVVVTGSYLISGGKVRLNSHLLDANTGDVLGEYVTTRPVNDLLPLISQTGASMRASFGLQAASPAGRAAAQASVSSNPEAYRLYIEGLERDRAFDGRAAVDAFQRSIALDPQFPLAHLELSNAYTILGQPDSAVAEAHKAESLDGALGQEEQMKIRAGARKAERRFQDAAAIYRDLFAMHPDEWNYGLLLAADLSDAGHPQQAMDVIRPLLSVNSPAAHDPRLYSLASDIEGVMGDWPSSLSWATAGAAESERRGAKVLEGRLLTSETQAMLYMNQLPAALPKTEQALAIAREYQDRSGELRALNRLGQIEAAMGHVAEAQKVLEQALSLEENLGQTQREIHTLSALGLNLQQQRNLPQAAVMFQRELVMAQDYGEPLYVAEAQLNVARLDMLDGNARVGKDMLQSLAHQAAELNDRQLGEEAARAMGVGEPRGHGHDR